MRPTLRTFALVLVGLCAAAPALAQTAYRLDPESRLWVEGASNRSDWTVQAGEIDGAVRMADAATVSAATLTVTSEKIVGDQSTIMDRLMHRTLKTDEYPTITYTLTEAAVTPGDAGTFKLQTQGQLTIAGETRTVDIPIEGERMADGRFRFRGSHPVKMTDYGMQPPTAMFGALRTADDVTVHFDLVVVPE